MPGLTLRLENGRVVASGYGLEPGAFCGVVFHFLATDGSSSRSSRPGIEDGLIVTDSDEGYTAFEVAEPGNVRVPFGRVTGHGYVAATLSTTAGEVVDALLTV